MVRTVGERGVSRFEESSEGEVGAIIVKSKDLIIAILSARSLWALKRYLLLHPK